MKNLAILLSLSVVLCSGCRWDHSPKGDGGDDNGGSTSTGHKLFDAAWQADIKTARLEISGGACTFKLSDTTGKLFSARVNDSTRHFSLEQSSGDSTHVVSFKMDSKDHDDNNSDKIIIKMSLNPKPVWDMTVELGAATSEFDLTPFKIRNLDVNCGVGDFKTKLRPILPDTYVNIKTSIAEVVLSIPKDAGCEVETESSMGSTNLDGFDKKDGSHYETPGFASAKNKIHVKAKFGLSTFTIKRF